MIFFIRKQTDKLVIVLLIFLCLNSCYTDKELVIEDQNTDAPLQEENYVIANVKGIFYTLAKDEGDGYYSYNDDMLVHQDNIVSMEATTDMSFEDITKEIDSLNVGIKKFGGTNKADTRYNSVIEQGAVLWGLDSATKKTQLIFQ